MLSRVVLKRTIVQYKSIIIEHKEGDNVRRKALEQDNGNGYEAKNERYQRRVHSVEEIK